MRKPLRNRHYDGHDGREDQYKQPVSQLLNCNRGRMSYYKKKAMVMLISEHLETMSEYDLPHEEMGGLVLPYEFAVLQCVHVVQKATVWM